MSYSDGEVDQVTWLQNNVLTQADMIKRLVDENDRLRKLVEAKDYWFEELQKCQSAEAMKIIAKAALEMK